MMIASMTAAMMLSLGAGVPPPIAVPPGVPKQELATKQVCSLGTLAGEWEGEVCVTSERGTSVSLVGLSATQDEGTGEVLMGFQGLAFAAPFEGIARLTRTIDGSTTCAWYDTLCDGAIAFDEACITGESSADLVFDSLTATDHRVLRQTMTIVSEGHLQIEITSHRPGERAAPVLSMDLYRLPSGQLSMGSGLTTTPELLAKLDTGTLIPTTRSANINPDAE